VATPGCLAAGCRVGEDGQRVVTTGQWETEAVVDGRVRRRVHAGVDIGYDERESRSREVCRLGVRN
jgi:hypothetical protein